MLSTLQVVCDSADVDAATGVCANPVWVPIQYLLPPLDATAGVAIGLGILACWALAFGYLALQRVGE